MVCLSSVIHQTVCDLVFRTSNQKEDLIMISKMIFIFRLAVLCHCSPWLTRHTKRIVNCLLVDFHKNAPKMILRSYYNQFDCILTFLPQEYFETFGEIESVKLKMDPVTGRSRGFAFLLYKDIESIDKAADGSEHQIKVVTARSRNTPL